MLIITFLSYPIFPKVVLSGCAPNSEYETDKGSELDWLVTACREESPDRCKKQISWEGGRTTTVSFLLAEMESRFMSSKILLMQAVSRGNSLFSCFLLRGKLSSVESLYLFPAATTPSSAPLGAVRSVSHWADRVNVLLWMSAWRRCLLSGQVSSCVSEPVGSVQAVV